MRQELRAQARRREGCREVREPSRAGKLGRPHDVDGKDVEVVGRTLERGEKHLARDVGRIRQRLGAQQHIGVLAAEAVQESMKRGSISPERLVLEDDRDLPRRRRIPGRPRARRECDQADREGAHFPMMGRSRGLVGAAERPGIEKATCAACLAP